MIALTAIRMSEQIVYNNGKNSIHPVCAKKSMKLNLNRTSNIQN